MDNVNVTTRIYDSLIEQRIEFDNTYDGVGMRDFTTNVIRLCDEGIIQALSEMGYLNPDEADKAIRLANLRGQAQALRSIRSMVVGEWLDKKLASEIMRVEHLIGKESK